MRNACKVFFGLIVCCFPVFAADVVPMDVNGKELTMEISESKAIFLMTELKEAGIIPTSADPKVSDADAVSKFKASLMYAGGFGGVKVNMNTAGTATLKAGFPSVGITYKVTKEWILSHVASLQNDPFKKTQTSTTIAALLLHFDMADNKTKTEKP